MNLLSAGLRIVSGLLIVIFSWISLERNQGLLAQGKPVQMFGQQVDFTVGQVNLALGGFILIGVMLILLGIANLSAVSRK